MLEAFNIAMGQAEDILKDEGFGMDSDCLFISKSIGTAISAAYQGRHGISSKNIYFTPVEESFQFFAPNSGIVFHGTADPWARTPVVKNGCEKLQLPLYLTENANHSLETGNVTLDINELGRIMEICDKEL